MGSTSIATQEANYNNGDTTTASPSETDFYMISIRKKKYMTNLMTKTILQNRICVHMQNTVKNIKTTFTIYTLQSTAFLCFF
jgi:hypothetical protein